MDFIDEFGENQSVYLGREGFIDEDSNIRVLNIRTPFGSLYHQSKIGELEQRDIGVVTVNLRRSIESSNGQVIDFHDIEWNQDEGYLDPILEKRLNEAAKNKLSEIWETIQAEQDKVMREAISKPIIIQGSAGSGKTIIAMHRISYLLYEYEGKLNPNKLLILGPNKMYLKYMEDISPDINKIKQHTFEDFCKSRIPFEKYNYVCILYKDDLAIPILNAIESTEGNV